MSSDLVHCIAIQLRSKCIPATLLSAVGVAAMEIGNFEIQCIYTTIQKLTSDIKTESRQLMYTKRLSAISRPLFLRWAFTKKLNFGIGKF